MPLNTLQCAGQTSTTENDLNPNSSGAQVEQPQSRAMTWIAMVIKTGAEVTHRSVFYSVSAVTLSMVGGL